MVTVPQKRIVRRKSAPKKSGAMLVCELRIARENLKRALCEHKEQTFAGPDVSAALEIYISALHARLKALPLSPLEDWSYTSAIGSRGWKSRKLPFIWESYLD